MCNQISVVGNTMNMMFNHEMTEKWHSLQETATASPREAAEGSGGKWQCRWKKSGPNEVANFTDARTSPWVQICINSAISV